jgi:hypothetical protein
MRIFSQSYNQQWFIFTLGVYGRNNELFVWSYIYMYVINERVPLSVFLVSHILQSVRTKQLADLVSLRILLHVLVQLLLLLQQARRYLGVHILKQGLQRRRWTFLCLINRL